MKKLSIGELRELLTADTDETVADLSTDDGLRPDAVDGEDPLARVEGVVR